MRTITIKMEGLPETDEELIDWLDDDRSRLDAVKKHMDENSAYTVRDSIDWLAAMEAAEDAIFDANAEAAKKAAGSAKNAPRANKASRR